MWLHSKYQLGRGDDDNHVNPLFTFQLDLGWAAGWHWEIGIHPPCIPKVKAFGSVPHTQKGIWHWLCLGQVEKKICVVWYSMGGCSVHKPLFVRRPHAIQRTLCPQGRSRAVKTKRDTGKASGSLFPSEKPSSFLNEVSGYEGRVD